MKKIAVFAVILVAVIVGAAVWFSPLASDGVREYRNNADVGALDGICYPGGTTVRADYVGSEADMYDTLDGMLATPVASARSGGSLIVYAYSPRVSGKVRTLISGERYNVMAAYKDGRYAVGMPLLQGSY